MSPFVRAAAVTLLTACASAPSHPDESPAPVVAPPSVTSEPIRAEPPRAAPAIEICRIAKPSGAWPPKRGGGHDQWIPGLYQYDKKTPQRVALTFDDGPGKYTPRVLDVLAKRGVTATFFVVGRSIWAGTMPYLQRIVAEGHALGNHTYRHDFSWGFTTYDKIAPRFYEAELELTQMRVDLALLAKDRRDFEALDARVFGAYGRFIAPDVAVRLLPKLRQRHAALLAERNGGRSPHPLRFVRPPFGRPFYGGPDRDRAIFSDVVNRMGLLHVLWQGSTGDSDPRLDPNVRFSRHFLVARLAELGAEGGVILAHERVPEAALDEGLATLLSQSVTIAPLARLIADKFGCAEVDHLWSAVDLLRPEHLGQGAPADAHVR